jgi:hypothetical protein
MPLGTALRKNTETPKPVDPVPINGTGSVSFCIVVGNQRAVRLRRLRTQLPATLRTFISEYVKTTVADPANQKVPDLLDRDFTAAAPNATYVGDF